MHHPRRTACTGAVLLLAGIVCFLVKMCAPEYIDAAGILHEPFFLLPAGYLCLSGGLLCLLLAALQRRKTK